MPVAGQPQGGFPGSSGWGGGGGSSGSSSGGSSTTGTSTPEGTTQTGTGKPVEYTKKPSGGAQYQGVATRTPAGGGETEYYYGGSWNKNPPSNISGAYQSGGSWVIPVTTSKGELITYVTAEKKVPVGYSGEKINPPSTLEQSYKSDVFSVSYPGSLALNAYTVGLTGWGETPAGKTFLPYATETTTITYTSVGSSNIISDIKPGYESTSWILPGGGVVSSKEQPFGSIPGTWKAIRMPINTYMNIDTGQLYSVDLSRGSAPSGLMAISGFLWSPPKTQAPEIKIDPSVFTGPLRPVKNIGTRQDLSPMPNLPDFSKIYPSGVIRGVIPDIFAEKRAQQKQLEYERSPAALLAFPLGFISAVYSGTVGIPETIGKLITGDVRQNLFYAKESATQGISEFITKTITFSWTPMGAAYFGGNVMGSIFTGEFIYKPAMAKMLPYFTKTSVVGLEKGYVTGTKEVPGIGLQYDIDLYGASQARTTISYMGQELTIGGSESLSKTAYTGFILNEPLRGVEVIGFSGGGVYTGGKILPSVGVGVLGKEQTIPTAILEISPGRWEILPSMQSTPGVSFSKIGEGGTVWRSNFILNKIYQGPTAEGPGAFYVSYSKMLSEGGAKASGLGGISIVDLTKTNTFQAYSGINYELSTQMTKLGSESLQTSQVAAISSSLSSAATTPSRIGVLAYNLLGIVPAGGKSTIMTSNIQITEPVTKTRMTSAVAQLEKTIPQATTSITTITKTFSPQAYITRQIEKVISTSRITPASITRTSDMTRTADLSRTRDISRTQDLTRTMDVTRTQDITKTTDITRTLNLTRTMEATRTMNVTRTIQKTPTITPPPPPPPPTIEWPPLRFGGPSDISKIRLSNLFGGRKKQTEYTPSIVSGEFNLRGLVNTKAVTSGLNIRLIPSYPSKRRKKR